MIVKNHSGQSYTSLGVHPIGNIPYDIVELPHVVIVNGFLTKYLMVPSKSLCKEVPKNIE